MNRTSNGRGWAYAGTALGGLVSMATNVAHSYVPPAGAPASWQPPLGAPLLALFWPIALFVSIEILSRIKWQSGWRYILLRFLGLLPVAVVAAIVSYNHLSGLLAHYGEPHITIVIGPLAVDGLMVMSASAIMSTRQGVPDAAPETVPGPVVPEVPETPSEQPENRVPKPRSRTGKKTARKTAAPRLSEEQLLEEAAALNETALAATGEPVSLRKLKTELRIGHPAAVKLRDTVIVTALGTAPETAPAGVLEHANGTTL